MAGIPAEENRGLSRTQPPNPQAPADNPYPMNHYKPMTAEEAAHLSLRPEGAYPFEVADAKAGTSRRGDAMIALVLHCFDATGGRFTVRDWLVHGSANRWNEKKVYEFAQTVGKAPAYAAGRWSAEECLAASGWVFVGIEKGKPKDETQPDGDKWPDRNCVKYYTAKPAASAPANLGPASAPAPPRAATAAPAAEGADEDVPF